MKLQKIRIHNFLIFQDVELDFDDDIYFIVGDNKDESSQVSNGAGKSALMQSIGWCLYEDLRKGLLKNDVIGSRDSWCWVGLTIAHDGKVYNIDRYRGHKDHGNRVLVSILGADGTLTKHNNAETNKLIEIEFGITSKMFYNCCYSDESEVKPPFVSLTPTKMLESVMQILDIERFDKQMTLAKEKINKRKDTLGILDMKVVSLSEKRQGLNKDIDSLTYQLEMFEEDRQARVQSCLNMIARYQSEIDELEAELLQHDVNELQEIMVKTYGAKEEREILKTQEKKIRVDLANVDAVIGKLVNLESMIENSNKELSKQYDNLMHNTSCEYCGGQIQYSSKTDWIKEGLRKKLNDVDKQKLLTVAQKRKKLREAEVLQTTLTGNQNQREQLEAVLEKRSEVSALLKDIDSIKFQIGTRNNHIFLLEKQISEIKEKKPELVKLDLNRKNRDLEASKREAKDLFKQIDQAELDIEATKVVLSTLKNMKAGTLNSFIYQLAEQVNINLAELTDGDFSCNLSHKKNDLKLEFTNVSKHGVYYPYSVFSRGERVRIAKAVSFALTQVVGADLLIEDEGLSGLDPAGVYSVVDFMIQSSKDRKLFFVSHDQNVIDYFDNFPIIKVVKENGVSTAEIVKR